MLCGCVFFDVGSDLKSGAQVLGRGLHSFTSQLNLSHL